VRRSSVAMKEEGLGSIVRRIACPGHSPLQHLEWQFWDGVAETSDPPASAFLERRPLKQEGSLAHPVNGYIVRADCVSPQPVSLNFSHSD
jgi:hypothetical protein